MPIAPAKKAKIPKLAPAVMSDLVRASPGAAPLLLDGLELPEVALGRAALVATFGLQVTEPKTTLPRPCSAWNVLQDFLMFLVLSRRIPARASMSFGIETLQNC